MVTATLTKWGNSQGVIIPKVICEEVGIAIGDHLVFLVEDGSLRMLPVKGHHRTRVLSASSLFEGWEGPYEPPRDWPSLGNEVDLGAPAGSEVW